MNRLLFADATQGRVTLTGARFHHLARVLRARVGDELELFDGKGHAFDATVLQLEQEQAVLEVGEARAQPTPRPLHIVQGLPKGDKLELVLQKATELGATHFWPVETERSIVKLAGKAEAKQERWQRIVDEAARQCGRTDVPIVELPGALKQAIAALPPGTRVLVLDEAEHTVRLRDAVTGSAAQLALVVGPEGGLSRDEVEALVSQGAVPVTLGPLILRTETAALAATAVLRHLEGWFG